MPPRHSREEDHEQEIGESLNSLAKRPGWRRIDVWILEANAVAEE
jgi:hypothetical protein